MGICSQCHGLVTGNLTGAEHQIFLSQKQLSGCNTGLMVPSEELVQIVNQLELCFCQQIVHVVHMKKVMARLVTQLGKVVSTELACVQGKCTLMNKIIMLFCKIRVHFALKLASLSLS